MTNHSRILTSQLSSVFEVPSRLPSCMPHCCRYGPLLMAATGPWDSSINCLRMPRGLDVTKPDSWLTPIVSSKAPLGSAFAVVGDPSIVFVPYALVQGEQFTTYPVF